MLRRRYGHSLRPKYTTPWQSRNRCMHEQLSDCARTVNGARMALIFTTMQLGAMEAMTEQHVNIM